MGSNFSNPVRRCAAVGTVGALGALLLMAVPVRAQIVNGGFEANDFSGWTVTSGTYVTTPGIAYTPVAPNPGNPGSSAIVPPPALDPVTGLSLVNSGAYAARINSPTAGNTYTIITQSFTTTTESDVYFAWAAVLQYTAISVPAENRPKISITLSDSIAGNIFIKAYNGRTLDADYGKQASYGGNTWAYTDWQVVHRIVPAGHVLTLSVQAEGGLWSSAGLGGYAYVDGFGSNRTGPGGYNASGAPEPGTVALGLSALAMAGGSFLLKLRRRQTTSKS